jgi:hypothetical protein
MATERKRAEAGSQISKLEKLESDWKRALLELAEIEAYIGQAEDVLRLRRSTSAEPLVERLERIGVSKAGLAGIAKLLKMANEVMDGTTSPETRTWLAARHAAEESALCQLMAIVERTKKS